MLINNISHDGLNNDNCECCDSIKDKHYVSDDCEEQRGNV